MSNILNVTSEIGRLKKVLLYCPGEEVENLTPNLMKILLFDDIPYLEIAIKEHKEFANVLINNGVEVLYLDQLISETLDFDKSVKVAFISQFIQEADIRDFHLNILLTKYFNSFSTYEMVRKMIAGIRKDELYSEKITLQEQVAEDYLFICDPMPNLYFTRDPFCTIGNGIVLNKMKTKTRNRETIFAEYIFKHHPSYCNKNIPIWYSRTFQDSIEGGDILILSKNILAIGISQRTSPAAIEVLARNLFNGNNNFNTIIALQIPNKRTFMHLDTVLTQVDYDKFTIYSEIETSLTVYKITKNNHSEYGLNIKKEKKHLKEILEETLNRKITLIKCGGDSPIDSAREQWNDGSNTLAIAPGEVIVYSRNHVTNKLLQKNGIKIYIIPSSELSRGRGGPRCMSMPLEREDINI